MLQISVAQCLFVCQIQIYFEYIQIFDLHVECAIKELTGGMVMVLKNTGCIQTNNLILISS